MVHRLRLVSQGLLGHVKDSCGRELYNLFVPTLHCLSYLGEASHGRGGHRFTGLDPQGLSCPGSLVVKVGTQIALPGSPWESTR